LWIKERDMKLNEIKARVTRTFQAWATIINDGDSTEQRGGVIVVRGGKNRARILTKDKEKQNETKKSMGSSPSTQATVWSRRPTRSRQGKNGGIIVDYFAPIKGESQ